MSEELSCVRLYQPDMPFEEFIIYRNGNTAIQIYHDPTELTVSLITKQEADNRIAHFDLLINGGISNDPQS